jgi:hypothetical protein
VKYKLSERERTKLILDTESTGDYSYENAVYYICELEAELTRANEENRWLMAELDSANELIEKAMEIVDGGESEEYESD